MKISKPLYYILNCTWGILMTAVGGVVALALIIAGYKPERHAGSIYFNVGKSWGGAELGLFFLTDEHDAVSVKNHEFGHSLQNCLWGPLMPFVVCLPSAARYWVREFKSRKLKENFALTLMGVACIIILVLTSIAVVFQLEWVLFLMLGIFMYTAALTYWLLYIEIPKYDKGDVPYDSIWFEGQATEWGTKIAEEW